VAALDTPVPFAPALEEFCLPDTGKIVEALRDLNSY
jgi:pyruvate/2-oxoglutarate/acetoin dehydrogenase E1 component